MSSEPAQQEKRRFERFPTLNLVSFAHLTPKPGRGPSLGLARTLDVCTGGARVETPRRLDIGDRLELEIAVGATIVRVDATVVHVEDNDPDMTRAGVSFDPLRPVDRETLLAVLH